MKQLVVEIPKTDNIFLELDELVAPKTVGHLIKNLPFKVGLNVWGDEIYTDPTPIKIDKENAKSVVELFDVAYWPPGNA
ncbi:MAG: cyclophilin-like family protein, partial [Candidatus Nitrosotenuis sp.]